MFIIICSKNKEIWIHMPLFKKQPRNESSILVRRFNLYFQSMMQKKKKNPFQIWNFAIIPLRDSEKTFFLVVNKNNKKNFFPCIKWFLIYFFSFQWNFSCLIIVTLNVIYKIKKKKKYIYILHQMCRYYDEVVVWQKLESCPASGPRLVVVVQISL